MGAAKGVSHLIEEALRKGERRTDIAKRLRISKGTVTYHANKLGMESLARKPKYDWGQVREYLKDHGVRESIAHFGMSKKTWHVAVSDDRIPYKPAHILSPEEVFVVGKRARGVVKRCLLRHGVPYECAGCSLSEWCGKPLSLQLDHKNGDGNDNRRENLRFLCPNCHSQTPTFAGRNMKKRRSGVVQ